MKLSIVLLLGALLAGPVAARESTSRDVESVPLSDITTQNLPEQRAAVLAAFAEGERFAELDKEGRQRVIDSFDRMQGIVGTAASVDLLPQEAKVELFNEQALLNEVLTQAQRDSRVTCKRYRTVNSRLKNGECHTAAEWERRRERARKLMDMNKRAVICVEVAAQPGLCS